jgi:hypothetical protein
VPRLSSTTNESATESTDSEEADLDDVEEIAAALANFSSGTGSEDEVEKVQCSILDTNFRARECY